MRQLIPKLSLGLHHTRGSTGEQRELERLVALDAAARCEPVAAHGAFTDGRARPGAGAGAGAGAAAAAAAAVTATTTMISMTLKMISTTRSYNVS